MKKTITSAFVLLLCFSFCFAGGTAEITLEKKYVASTSWVASIAQLAGLDNIVTIAPSDLKHPPEYEVTPQDLVTIANAQLFMQAGYEKMMKTLSSASGIKPEKILKVKTTNTLNNLESMVKIISEKAGTQDKAEKRFYEYSEIITQARDRIANSPNKNIAVFSNVNQAEFAEDLGLNVVSTFGPGAMTSDQIAQAALNKYPLVLDNYHAPVAFPVTEVSPESTVLILRNFPEKNENNALTNVIRKNLEMLWSTGLF